MSDDLTERLRNPAIATNLTRRAADRIETQDARIEELEAEAYRLKGWLRLIRKAISSLGVLPTSALDGISAPPEDGGS
jgi:mannitol-1-phosphate/altronate dehydrogenase